MTYSMVINRSHCDSAYVHDIKTWKEVTDYLKNNLEWNATSVHIAKYGSDGRLLGERTVRMHNLWNVLNAEKDKYALS